MRPLVALLLIGIVASACQSGAESSLLGPPSADIVIASELPISDIEYSGLAADRAIRLAISEHARIGRFRLAYWPLDDAIAGARSAETGIQNISWAVDVSRVLGIVGPWASEVAVGAIPVANKADLVMVSPSNTRTCLTLQLPTCPNTVASLHPTGRNNFFRIAAPDPVQGLALARYAVTHLGVTHVAVINEDGSHGEPTIESFKRELRRLGGEVVIREDVDANTTSFKDFIASAKNLGAGAIFGMGRSGICAARAQAPVDMIFLGTDEFATDPDCLTQAGGRQTAIFATYGDVDISSSSDRAAEKAVADFEKAYPHAPIVDYTFASYDSAQLLISAIEQAIKDKGGNLPNRSDVLNAVAHITYTGLTGTYSFDSNGDATAPLMEMYDVENGAWVNKGKIDASAAPS